MSSSSRSVDHRYIASLCARHASGDPKAAAGRFCEARQLPARDKLRIQRLAEQQGTIEKVRERAAQQAAQQGYIVAPAAKKEK